MINLSSPRYAPLSHEECSRLLLLYLNGDRDAGERITNGMTRFAVGYANSHRPAGMPLHDAVAESLIAIYESLSSWKPAANKLTTHVRCNIRRRWDALQYFECRRTIESDAVDTVEFGEHSDNIIDIKKIMRRLPAKERRVIDMRYGQGMTHAQVAGALRVSRICAQKITRQALTRLSKLKKMAELAEIAKGAK